MFEMNSHSTSDQIAQTPPPMYQFTLTNSGVVVNAYNPSTGYEPLQKIFPTIGSATAKYNPRKLQDGTFSQATGGVPVKIDLSYDSLFRS